MRPSSTPQRSLVSRLQDELKLFTCDAHVSQENLENAQNLYGWSFLFNPNTNIEILGSLFSKNTRENPEIVSGRILQVDPHRRLIMTTTGLYRLKNKQLCDMQRACTETKEDLELEAVHEKIERYRRDLDVAFRYISELSDETCDLLRASKNAFLVSFFN